VLASGQTLTFCCAPRLAASFFPTQPPLNFLPTPVQFTFAPPFPNLFFFLLRASSPGIRFFNPAISDDRDTPSPQLYRGRQARPTGRSTLPGAQIKKIFLGFFFPLFMGSLAARPFQMRGLVFFFPLCLWGTCRFCG